MLDSEFGAAAKWVLNDSPVRLLITAKGIDTHAWYFVRDNPKNKQTASKLGLRDCAVASASAPTYFSPSTINIGGKATVLVDGGVGVAGNPVYQACVEAFYYEFTPADTSVVSPGTGFFPNFPGIVQRFDWQLPNAIDMADTSSIPELIKIGRQPAARNGLEADPEFALCQRGNRVDSS